LNFTKLSFYTYNYYFKKWSLLKYNMLSKSSMHHKLSASSNLSERHFYIVWQHSWILEISHFYHHINIQFAKRISSCRLFNNNMWGCGQHSYCGNDGEHGERDQAQSIKNHGCKLPIIFHSSCFVIITDLVSDNSNLL